MTCKLFSFFFYLGGTQNEHLRTMPRSGETTRHVVYTINNYTAGDIEVVIGCNKDPVTGHVAYYEVGESGGRTEISQKCARI